MKVVLFLIFISCAFGACTSLNKYIGLPDDHPLEEFAEQLLKNKTGIDIDFTPNSPEQ